jgi:hypothetical protein
MVMLVPFFSYRIVIVSKTLYPKNTAHANEWMKKNKPLTENEDESGSIRKNRNIAFLCTSIRG